MRKILYILFITILYGCDSDIKEDYNYLVDNGNYEIFLNDYHTEYIFSSDHYREFKNEKITSSTLMDSLKLRLEKLKPKYYSMDVYPNQFGPVEDLNNQPLSSENENIEDLSGYMQGYPLGTVNGWTLGFLTNYPSLEVLSISSVCNFTFKINSKNNIRHFKLSSHSCGRFYADEPIQFNKLKKLESLHITRYIFSPRELEGISHINNLESLTLTDCELDIKDLIGLKKQLRYLNLSDSKVFNWHLLSEFKQLEVLYIANINNVVLGKKENVKFLSGLKKLRELSVKRNSINSLEWVKNHNNLERIYIQKTEIKDIPFELKKKKDLKIIK